MGWADQSRDVRLSVQAESRKAGGKASVMYAHILVKRNNIAHEVFLNKSKKKSVRSVTWFRKPTSGQIVLFLNKTRDKKSEDRDNTEGNTLKKLIFRGKGPGASVLQWEESWLREARRKRRTRCVWTE